MSASSESPDNAGAAAFWKEGYGLAWALIGDRGRAEELTQEAFLRLAKVPFERAQSPAAARALVLKTVRHLAIDELRRRSPESLEEALEGGVGAPATRELDPAAAAEASERCALVRQGLESLDPGWRAALYLRDGLGLPYRQIAETLDKSEDVVRTTLHRARARLRDWLRLRLVEGEC